MSRLLGRNMRGNPACTSKMAETTRQISQEYQDIVRRYQGTDSNQMPIEDIIKELKRLCLAELGPGSSFIVGDDLPKSAGLPSEKYRHNKYTGTPDHNHTESRGKVQHGVSFYKWPDQPLPKDSLVTAAKTKDGHSYAIWAFCLSDNTSCTNKASSGDPTQFTAEMASGAGPSTGCGGATLQSTSVSVGAQAEPANKAQGDPFDDFAYPMDLDNESGDEESSLHDESRDPFADSDTL